MSRPTLLIVFLASLGLLVAGCKGEYDPTLPPEGATTLAVTPETHEQAALGATVQLTDREILEIFYHATDGPNWANSTNWLTDAPLGEWYGVKTDEQGRVQRLRIGWNNLSGSIPPELGDLSHLTQLRIRANDLSGGPIPPELGNLANLTELWLNGLSSPIPAELGNLANLTDLSLRGLSGRIPPELGNLSRLTWLDLVGNDLSDGPIPPELGRLSNLTRLRLSGFWDSIPSEISNLANLRELRLGRLTDSIPSELGNLSSLTDLFLNGMTGPIPPELGNLASLRRLWLQENHFSSPLPPELGNLGNLHTLYIQANDLKGPIPPELGSLTKLETLWLEDNDLSGPVPANLSGMSDLRHLVLTDNPGMAGPLPVEITEIRWLQTLMAGGTGLCAPADPGFRRWLRARESSRIKPCTNGNSSAYLVQAIQSREFPVPLVAGKRAMLRVFPTATQITDVGIPSVEAHFFHEGRKTFVMYIPGKSEPIPMRVDEDSFAKSANAEIPGDIIQPGLEMVIEIDPDGTLDSELLAATRIPETGRLPVEVHDMALFDLRLIPFVWTETHDSSRVELIRAIAADPENHETLRPARTLLPIGDIRVTAHEPVLSSSSDAQSLLRETIAIRSMESGEEGVRSRYYMGILPPGYSGYSSGVALLGGKESVSSANPHTIAHELGHNLSLGHAACGRGAGGLDAGYPYPDGKIGARGYDFGSGTVVPPSHKDLMSYCGPTWISDYHFTKALYNRPSTTIDAVTASAPSATATKSILLWGGTDADGVPFLEPTFLVDAQPALPTAGGAYRISGRAGADGTELFSFTFDMPEISDGDGGSSFAFVLPRQDAWEGDLGSITLAGPVGSFTLDRDTDMPMTILRDRRTGQVRGFLRDPPPSTQAAADATDSVSRSTGLEMLFSRGIPSREAWH
ncbi:MAG: hypothetical protein OXR82_07855 [Gammaproteobacteria bacterium]|nr:hypothetical protein [Gammaproteobacteria bacterium]MDE0258290.1 hypothetical protein [Gammaproteobacteria bacterium]